MRIEKRKIAQITPSVVAHPSHMMEIITPSPFRNHPNALPPINAKMKSIMKSIIANIF